MRRTYSPAFDIWQMPGYLRAHIIPGQWITAGPNGPKGRYMGQGRGGSDVVAWQDNARHAEGGAKEYNRALRQYAKGCRL